MAGTNFWTSISSTVDVAFTDPSGNYTLARCAAANIPSGVAGYAIGCQLYTTDAGLLYTNTGSATSCTFTQVNTDSPGNIALTNGRIIVGNASNIGAGVAMSGDATIVASGVVTIAASAVTSTKLAVGIRPSHVVKFAGKVAWSGGAATLTTSVPGVVASDIVQGILQLAPSSACFLISASPSTDNITFTLSQADGGNASTVAYSVLRVIS